MVDTINISSSNSARNRTRNVPGTSARRTTDGINLPLILLLAALGVSSLSSSSPPSSVDGFRPTPPPHYDGRPRHRHHPARSERRLRPPGPLLESSGGGDGQDTPGDTTAGGGAVGGGSSLDSLDSILGRAGGGSRDGPLGFPGGGGGEGGGERFNPLSYARSGTGRRGGGGGATISVRKTRMMELTGELLNAVDAGNREDGGAAAARARARQILDRYRDFLLEPLEDDEAVLVSPGAAGGGRMDGRDLVLCGGAA